MQKIDLVNDKDPKQTIQIYSIESVDLEKSNIKPNIVFMLFGEHSREIISSETSLYLAKALCGKIKGYNNSTIKKILSFSKIYILPVLNIYGRDQVDNGDFCKRTNENDVDLNRNWNSHWEGLETEGLDTNPGNTPFSEWETKKLKEYLKVLKPNTFMTSHSGNLGIYSPFAYKKFNYKDLDSNTSNRLNKIKAIISKVNKDNCNCISGSIGNDLGYLCPGTCLDYLFENLNADYSFAFEIYSKERQKFYEDLINNENLEYFSYDKFLKKYGRNSLSTLTSLIQMKSKMKIMPSILSVNINIII
jgi:hypothetical protein